MNEFQLIMEDAACDQGMGIRPRQPVEQVIHQSGDLFRGRGHVNHGIATKNAHIARAQPPASSARPAMIVPWAASKSTREAGCRAHRP